MGQLAMTQNAGFGILSGEFLQQLIQCVFLGFGARVFGFAFRIQTAFIHDTEGTVVVVAGMHTLDGLWQEWDDTAIVAHVVVIRALAVLGLAAGYQVLHAERPVTGVGHTVHDQHFHIVMLQWFIILAHKPNGFNVSKPIWAAALHGECTSDCCNDCGEEFEYLGHVDPIYFYHF